MESRRERRVETLVRGGGRKERVNCRTTFSRWEGLAVRVGEKGASLRGRARERERERGRECPGTRRGGIRGGGLCIWRSLAFLVSDFVSTSGVESREVCVVGLGGREKWVECSGKPSLPLLLLLSLPSSPSLSTLDLREPLSPPATLSPPPPPPLFSSSPPDAREVDLFHVEREGGLWFATRMCKEAR